MIRNKIYTPLKQIVAIEERPKGISLQVQKENIKAISKKLVDRKTGLIRCGDNRCLYIENSSVIKYVFERCITTFSWKRKHEMNHKYRKVAESRCYLRVLYSVKILKYEEKGQTCNKALEVLHPWAVLEKFTDSEMLPVKRWIKKNSGMESAC